MSDKSVSCADFSSIQGHAEIPSSFPSSFLSDPEQGKVVERAAAEQLQQFLNNTAGLDPFQSGFRRGHGTETVLVAITDQLRCQMDQGGSALLVLLDLTAAFDTEVSTERWISSLSAFIPLMSYFGNL
nr:uncharacterized protein LOC132766280 isoform X2 [Anolis sagrei ordinatus]